MAVDIGACGSMGLALETTPGTYVAPTIFFPIQSENLQYNLDLRQRRGIRQVADLLGTIPGNATISGTINMEFFDDVASYFLRAARTNKVTTGTTNFEHVFTPAHCAGLGTGGKTLSLTVVRSGTVEAYVGCMVGSFQFNTDEGVLMMSVDVLGLDEATQADPTETYPTTQIPYGPGTYDLETPTGTDVADIDAFTFRVEDGLVGEHRLRAARGPAFLRYGERTTSLQVTRDFANRTDYDAFKAGTASSVSMKAARGADNSLEIVMPVAYKETYEFGLASQGDLVRASINYFGTYDATTTGSYEITIKNQVAHA